jgi:hypothetical protein
MLTPLERTIIARKAGRAAVAARKGVSPWTLKRKIDAERERLRLLGSAV